MRFPIKRFLTYYRPYRGPYFGVLAAAVTASAAALAFPLLVRFVTTDVLSSGPHPALGAVYRAALGMLAVIGVQAGCNYIVDAKGHAIGARMESDMRDELFAHVQKLSFGFFDRIRTGEMMSRITNDLLLVSELYHHGPEDYVKYGCRFVGAFVILAFINAPLTLVIFAFTPVLAVAVLIFNRTLGRSLLENQRRIAEVNSRVEDSLSGVRVVQSFTNEDVEFGRFRKENRRFLESRIGTYRAEAIVYVFVQGMAQLITLTVVVLGSSAIAHQSLTLPDLITFLLYVGYVTEPISYLDHMTTQFQEGITGFRRFMEIMDLKPTVASPSSPLKPAAVRGQIAFRDVTFAYEGTSDVLRGLSLAVEPGDFVAIVGPSGAGKTTLCSLIPRFYDVIGGAVLVDGVDVRRLDLAWLRSQVGVVQQDVYLFAGTVMENIRYGRPGASDEDVVAAAKHAHAHDFVEELPQGYATEIGQRGVRLSGGQRQRLSIARTFLKNPPILVLDEATSALDNESERIVKEALDELSGGRTTLVIAHRLSTIQSAQRIVVLSGGALAEEGTHAELLARNGVYASLYNRALAL